MGWIESPLYFCAASETARDVAKQLIETEVGTLPNHKFLEHSAKGEDFDKLPSVGADDGKFRTFVNDLTINKINPSTSIGLKVTSVSEINTVSETEQNDIFTGNDVDDFLDFSEDNPFGDPEAQ